MKILASLLVLVATMGPWVNAEEGNGPTKHEDSDLNAVCRPGSDDWPACRAIGYPACKPGVVRWPQCRDDAKTRR
ncbi:hypothetical protein PF005_g8823 [Phytophthora fragariae]|uniref:CBM1 domain-containing protein n=2 Tax=Phytophthora TaxID=4783 RepID=A0A6A3L2K9_9STRA|nr:hypothetical protein PF003_g485 [Phytophthora fragariae]KAE9033031.1 hypothetical protein PR002_g8872 [Phytophthora rubi]KAE8939193.1 hypothetical protein PF009_g10968 [Phytophthora fragariae]KAE9012158.1 hypothetical protein PF011_g9043 [Phytophthora fragariae]KAE9037029.1 hypothetical protein PR001_g8550 [Phytophthora rubi]